MIKSQFAAWVRLLSSAFMALATVGLAIAALIGADAYHKSVIETSVNAKHQAAWELLMRAYVVRDVFKTIRQGITHDSPIYKQPIAESFQHQPLLVDHPMYTNVHEAYDRRWLQLQNALVPYYPAFYKARALFKEKLDEPKNMLYECVNIYVGYIDWLGITERRLEGDESEEAKREINKAYEAARPYLWDMPGMLNDKGEMETDKFNKTYVCMENAISKYEKILKSEVPTLN